MSRSFLRDLQECVYQRLNALPYFVNITIYKRRQAYVDDALNKSLAAIKRKAGKGGVCVVIEMPKVGRDEMEGGAGAELITVLGIEVVENELINNSINGTHKRADEIAVEVFTALKGVGFASTDMMGPLESLNSDPVKEFKGDDTNVHFSVGLQCSWGLTLPAKCMDAHGRRLSGNSYELVSATSGAQIYYTLPGGGYPSSLNPAAILYAEPIVIDEDIAIRCIAYKEGLNPSDETVGFLTLQVVGEGDTAIGEGPTLIGVD